MVVDEDKRAKWPRLGVSGTQRATEHASACPPLDDGVSDGGCNFEQAPILHTTTISRLRILNASSTRPGVDACPPPSEDAPRQAGNVPKKEGTRQARSARTMKTAYDAHEDRRGHTTRTAS